MTASRKTILRAAAAMTLVLGLGAAGNLYYYSARPLVEVSTAALAPISEIIYASGTVEPVQWAKVVPLETRRVVELRCQEGQTVRKGQILGRQDDAEERGELERIEILHEQYRRDLDRAARDRDKGTNSKVEYEKKETAVRESSSKISTLQKKLEKLVFRAPMDGMVLRRDGKVGEIVGPTDVLFWVGKPSPLQVVADINEEEITKVELNQPALLSTEGFERESFHARVSQVTPKGDPTKKTYRVYLKLPVDSRLRIDMTVDVKIVIREKPVAVVIPVNSVVTSVDSHSTVQVVRDDRIREQRVSTDIRGPRLFEITEGVPAGTLVLSPARGDLKDGTRVRVNRPSTQEAKPGGGPDKDDLADSLSRHIDLILYDARRKVPSTP